MNAQSGRPQQRRPFFFPGLVFSGFDLSGLPGYVAGHEDTGRGLFPSRVGVASPGGGKAASMPESPD